MDMGKNKMYIIKKMLKTDLLAVIPSEELGIGQGIF